MLRPSRCDAVPVRDAAGHIRSRTLRLDESVVLAGSQAIRREADRDRNRRPGIQPHRTIRQFRNGVAAERHHGQLEGVGLGPEVPQSQIAGPTNSAATHPKTKRDRRECGRRVHRCKHIEHAAARLLDVRLRAWHDRCSGCRVHEQRAVLPGGQARASRFEERRRTGHQR